VDKIQAHLVSRNDSRIFGYQTLITSSFDKTQSSNKKSEPRDRGSKFRDDDEHSGMDSDTEARAAQPSSSNQGPSKLKARVVPAQHKFRSTTQNNRTLNGMFLPVPSPSSSSSAKNGGPSSEKDEIMEVDDEDEDVADPDLTSKESTANPENSGIRQAVAPLKVVESGCYLQSVLDLREEIKAMRHTGTC